MRVALLLLAGGFTAYGAYALFAHDGPGAFAAAVIGLALARVSKRFA